MAEQKAAEEKAALEKAAADKLAAEKAAAETKANLARAAAIEAAQKIAMDKAAAERAAADAAAKAKAEAEAALNKVIAEYTLGPDDTLSHVALKFYGSAAEPYWRRIYEFNKAVIGSNPGIVRPGTVLKIPVLPPELQKK